MFDTKNFPGAKQYWHMGKLYDWDTREIHTMSHVVHYGSSVFEGIRAYESSRGPAIFRLQEHIDRFFRSAAAINMKVPFTKEEIIEACRLVMRENRLHSAYIRPNLYYGYGNLGLTPRACPVELSIACWEWGAYLGAESLQTGVHTLLLPWKRFHPSQINASVKLGGLYVQSNIFATEARRMGYDEAVFLNLEDRISEGPGENILIVNGRTVKTNAKEESVLEGITRSTALELAEALGYKAEIGPITVEEFLNADEAFFTGTAAEITPITKVTDSRDRSLGQNDWKVYLIGEGRPGRITMELSRLYAGIVRGRVPEYEHWLTYAYDSVEEARRTLNAKPLGIAKGALTRY